MKFSKRSIRELGGMIVGDSDHFRRRSSYYITELFEEAGLPFKHQGEWRPVWAGEKVAEMLEGSANRPNELPDDLVALLRGLMNKEEAEPGDPDRSLAMLALNVPLKREGFEAFYGDDGDLYFKHLGSQTISTKPDPHKPFTKEEITRREQLSSYLDTCSEDELIEEVLLPLYRQLGYHRITAVGHEDKNLEHGKDVWMRFMLPSQHMLYFGLQVKKGKLDASADSTKRDGPNTNIAVIHNQVLMMLDSPVWDAEFNSTRLVDHAFIVAGGKITKSAQMWLARNLAPQQRSRVMFMDRNDILNLFISSNTRLPASALPKAITAVSSIGFGDDLDDDIPF
jgi:hypothetical protein